jgi:hypothetical protein
MAPRDGSEPVDQQPFVNIIDFFSDVSAELGACLSTMFPFISINARSVFHLILPAIETRRVFTSATWIY